MKNIIILFVLLLSCASHPIDLSNNAEQNTSLPDNYNVKIFSTGLPQSDFEELGKITFLQTENPGKDIEEIKKKACLMGGDAIINFEENEIIDTFLSKDGGQTVYNHVLLSGIVVKYKDKNDE